MAATRKKKRSPQLSAAVRLIIAVTAAVLLLFAVLMMLGRGDLVEQAPDSGARLEFGSVLAELARERGAAPDSIVADDPIRKVDGIFVRSWKIGLPDRAALNGLIADVEAAARDHGGDLAAEEEVVGGVTRVRVDLDNEAFDLHLVTEQRVPAAQPPATPTPVPTATPRPEPPAGARGKLAILLDDGGQSMAMVEPVAALAGEVAVSILPFLPFSVETAAALNRSGHEVWLHLPMEPNGYPANRPGPGAILLSMTEAEIRTTVHTAVNNVPHIVGVNNHMGSRATADLRTMTWVMQELKSRDLAFIDSRTTKETVAEAAARAQGVAAGRRHVFLDNERTPEAIRAQLAEAVYRARMDGEIIAIGHMAKVTVAVLREELPGLAERGADLVRPSALVQ